jgi:catechol 2,3-dioxygenase-like lactoylglutathione lyase family enzyme
MTPLLEVFDMPTSIAFYCEVLGFQVVSSDGKPIPKNDWIWLRLNGVDLMLNTAYESDQRPPAPDPARVSAHRDTCLYFGCPDPDSAYAYLVERGVRLRPPEIAPYGMKQLYASDPDNYNLCFQWRAEKAEQ